MIKAVAFLSREKLLNTIGKLRLILYEFAKKKSLTDPKVVRMSQRLDKLLNKYEQK